MITRRLVIPALILCAVLAILSPRHAVAATAKDNYYAAEAAYKKLKNNPKHLKYRDRWFQCIDRFQAVYRQAPAGPWAAAALFRSGNLYADLHRVSYRKADLREALDLYERIVKRFPKSRYRQKARTEIRLISGKTKKNVAVKAARKASGKSAAKTAKSTKFKPKRSMKAATRVTGKGGSIAAIIQKSQTGAAPAVKGLAENGKKAGRALKRSPSSAAAMATGSGATVSGLRFWSNPSYTRIVIDADREAPYVHHLLKKDPSIKKPQRLYIELSGSRLGKDLKKNIPIDDDLLKDVRAGQYTAEKVRVVVDIKSFKDYKIFSLKNPFRIVVDVWGKGSAVGGKPDLRPIPKAAAQSGTKIPVGALAKQLALGVRTIVIDAGHGGHDSGALGYLKGVQEKDITLAISKRLAKRLREKLGCNVIMTRTTDRYLTLEERTAIANTKNADLFISIHTNAARNRKAFGIETFFLNLATDDASISVAARENATSKKNISDLQSILTDLMQNAKINESSRLAQHVQNTLHRHMKKRYKYINNKGVKQAPFYVLLGARMPAILVETAFISNKRECKRLMTRKYQEALCDAIVAGVTSYINATSPTAGLGTLRHGPDGGKS